MKDQKVTLQSIADRLGLSKSTVAQVVSDRPGSRISPEIRAKVKTTAREMGYQPNQLAKALRMGRSNFIGFLSHSIDTLIQPGFLQSMYRAVGLAVNESDYVIVQLFDKPREKLAKVIQRGILDGMIFLTSESTNETVEFLKGFDIPLVLLNCCSRDDRASFVAQDYDAFGREAVRSMVQSGHKRLALVAFDYGCDSNQRLIAGFKGEVAKLQDKGVTGRWFDLVDMDAAECWERTAEKVLGEGPFDGYIVDIPQLAETLCRKAVERKQIIGENRDLIVFSTQEDTVMGCNYWKIYEHDNARLGQEAFRILVEQVENPEAAEKRCLVPFRAVENTLVNVR